MVRGGDAAMNGTCDICERIGTVAEMVLEENNTLTLCWVCVMHFSFALVHNHKDPWGYAEKHAADYQQVSILDSTRAWVEKELAR
jgi:hypothetical protein